MTLLAPKPAHIPDELVGDIDIYSLPGLVDGKTDDIHSVWKSIQDSHPPLFWTPRNGGHWLITSHDLMLQTGTNADAFSNRDIFVPKGKAPFLTPTNMDPPAQSGLGLIAARIPSFIGPIDCRLDNLLWRAPIIIICIVYMFMHRWDW